MVTLRTTLCDLPRIEAAPISGAATPALVAPVSNAGGLGMFAMANRDPEGIRRIIHEAQQLTDRPFGANFLLRPQEETDARLDACLDAGERHPLRGTVSGRAILEARIVQVENLAEASDYPVGRALAEEIGCRHDAERAFATRRCRDWRDWNPSH